MKNIEAFFKNHQGYARMKDLKDQSFHTRDIAKAVENGIIEKIKPGLYKLIDFTWDEHSGFVDIAKAKGSAIICLTSALSYHNLSTINPGTITVAVPMNTDKFSLDYPPIKVYYFPESLYSFGIEEKKTMSGNFKIYNAEKTICDMFRYRNKLGEDLPLEGLKNYLKRKDADIPKLHEYAIKCKVKTVMLPYIKAMVIV
ncbi:MAG: Abortive infection protein AbiEi [Candidatus Cloacimonadota bacterium]|nr:Abortive infection protein AbiEi [Candidatus Cloacimonadota bacterium]